MYMETHQDSGREVARQLVKHVAWDDTYWQSTGTLDLIPPVEVLDIKGQEIHDKWGKFIPQERKADWKYYNDNPGPARCNHVKKHTTKGVKGNTERPHSY